MKNVVRIPKKSGCVLVMTEKDLRAEKERIEKVRAERKRNIEASFIYVNEVKDVKQLKVGITYYTDNYELLKHLEHNRGKKKSYDEGKVKNFVRLIESGEYFSDVSEMIVNMILCMLDGNNKHEALKRTGEYIVFKLTNSADFNNVDENTLLNNISILNGVNSKWSGTDNFDSAKDTNAPLAIRIANYFKLIEIMFRYDFTSILKPQMVCDFADNFSKGFKNQTRLRADYCNAEAAERFNDVKFVTLLNNVCTIMYNVKEYKGSARPWLVVRSLYEHLLKEKLDINANFADCAYKSTRLTLKQQSEVEKFTDTVPNAKRFAMILLENR